MPFMSLLAPVIGSLVTSAFAPTPSAPSGGYGGTGAQSFIPPDQLGQSQNFRTWNQQLVNNNPFYQYQGAAQSILNNRLYGNQGAVSAPPYNPANTAAAAAAYRNTINGPPPAPGMGVAGNPSNSRNWNWGGGNVIDTGQGSMLLPGPTGSTASAPPSGQLPQAVIDVVRRGPMPNYAKTGDPGLSAPVSGQWGTHDGSTLTEWPSAPSAPSAPPPPSVVSGLGVGSSPMPTSAGGMGGPVTGNAQSQAYQNAANLAGAASGLMGGNALNYSQLLGQQINPTLAAGMQAYLTGLDPQRALYDQLSNKASQRVNADLSARGLGMSPVGAELASQQANQFDMNWQNQQLQRQLAGLQGLTGANQSGANLTQAANQSGGQGASFLNQMGLMPYTAYNNITNDQMAALQQYGQYGQAGNAQLQQGINNAATYMGLGQTGNQLANSAYNAANAQANQTQQQLGGLGAQLGTGVYNWYQGQNNSNPNNNFWTNAWPANQPGMGGGQGLGLPSGGGWGGP